ncbi:MAG: hypothetical protein BGN85_03410 [Alphaproteobacteria bacterium 64-11]|nr:MAG: hypothetical protein BGN85_03410 [Alphaproteobacteria bacterium 64-11]
MRIMAPKIAITALLAWTLAWACADRAAASPWAEVGDNQLRGDIELLAASGAVDDISTHWPLPWNSLVETLGEESLSSEPLSVQDAARRVMADARQGTAGGFSASLFADATNQAATVYGFDGMGRGEGAAQFSLGYNTTGFSSRISLGAFSPSLNSRDNKVMPEGTYFASTIGEGALVYAGYLDHWWGPGWISSLSLSNNARPMPQIGIERLDTSASSWPILHWLGPWQAEFLVGMLDGPRMQRDTFYNGLRLTFHPLDGLEIGLARTEEFCGQGHPCSPLRDYFDFNNDPTHVNRTNDQGLIDIKYSYRVGGVPVQSYLQVMNEDSDPISHSGSSHLFGTTVFLPTRRNPVRLTIEYTDSVATKDIFGFGDVMHGFAYNNGTYPDGMRYRDRSLGFSLDSDSRLLSLQGSWTDSAGRFYELSLHHAVISNPNIQSFVSQGYNVVTTAPVIANIGEARVSLPLSGMKLDLAARLQDDQPRPDKGFAASIEAALRVAL